MSWVFSCDRCFLPHKDAAGVWRINGQHAGTIKREQERSSLQTEGEPAAALPPIELCGACWDTLLDWLAAPRYATKPPVKAGPLSCPTCEGPPP